MEAWTPSTEILINPSSKMALTFSSMVVDTGLFVFQGLSTLLSNRLEFNAAGMCLCKIKKRIQHVRYARVDEMASPIH